MNSNSKSINIHTLNPVPNATKIVNMMTMIAWIVLGIGVITCLANIADLTTRNWGLMIGVGFLVGSVHIYVIGTAIGLVHKRALNQSYKASDDSN